MTPVGKIVKLFLALTVAAAIAAGVAGCKKEKPAASATAQQPAEQKAEAKAEAKPHAAEPVDLTKPRELEIKVTEDGYVPSPITLAKGQPVVLKLTRTTDKTCATEFILDEYNINQKMPLNETVTVNFTPDKEGELKYGCAMGKMISGRFRVE